MRGRPVKPPLARTVWGGRTLKASQGDPTSLTPSGSTSAWPPARVTAHHDWDQQLQAGLGGSGVGPPGCSVSIGWGDDGGEDEERARLDPEEAGGNVHIGSAGASGASLFLLDAVIRGGQGASGG